MNNSNQLQENRVDKMEDVWLERQRKLVEGNGKSIFHDRDFLQAKTDVYKDMLQSFKGERLNRQEKIALRLMKATYNNTRRQLYPGLYKLGFPRLAAILMAPFRAIGSVIRFLSRLTEKSPPPPTLNYAAPGVKTDQPGQPQKQEQQSTQQQNQKKQEENRQQQKVQHQNKQEGNQQQTVQRHRSNRSYQQIPASHQQGRKLK